MKSRQASSRFLRPDDAFNKCAVPLSRPFANRSLVLISKSRSLIVWSQITFSSTHYSLSIHSRSFYQAPRSRKHNEIQFTPKQPNIKCYETNLTLSGKKPSVLLYNTNYKYNIIKLGNLQKIARKDENILWAIQYPGRRHSSGGETTCTIDEKFRLKWKVSQNWREPGNLSCVAISSIIKYFYFSKIN